MALPSVGRAHGAAGPPRNAELHPNEEACMWDLSAGPETDDAPHLNFSDLLAAQPTIRLGEILTKNIESVTRMLLVLHRKRRLQFLVHHTLTRGVGGPAEHVGCPLFSMAPMVWLSLKDIEKIVANAFQIAYAAYHQYRRREFGHDPLHGPSVLWHTDDETTNVAVDVEYRGHHIRTRFVEDGTQTYVAVVPVDAD